MGGEKWGFFHLEYELLAVKRLWRDSVLDAFYKLQTNWAFLGVAQTNNLNL